MKSIFIIFFILSGILVMAQDTTNRTKPVITGSVDVYYRYNFANSKFGNTNNFTSFTNSQNSFELGMASLHIDHNIGKIGGTIDLGFGRRAEEFSYNDGENNDFFSLANVKQLYLSYSPWNRVKFTAGKWGTHIGYEMADAYLNRNYSMSYMFSYGPFFHTGIKTEVNITDKTVIMAGIANPTDYSTTTRPAKFIIGQFSTITSNDRIKIYLNYQGGKYSKGSELNQVDLVINGTINSYFSAAYNGTTQFRKASGSSTNNWWGSALYINYDPTSTYGITLRSEYFNDDKGLLGLNGKILAFTISNNIRVTNLTIIPELRYENASGYLFEKHNGGATRNSFTGLLTAVYSF